MNGKRNEGIRSLMKKSVFLVLVFLILLLVIGSLRFLQSTTVTSSAKRLNFPLAKYVGLDWISETKLAAFVGDENYGVTGYYLGNDERFYRLELPPFVAKLDCNEVNDFLTGIHYTQPTLLPDGRLGLINKCISLLEYPGLRRRYMVAYDFETKESNLLVNEPLPRASTNGFTWNPNMTLGIAQTYGGLSGTLYWVSPDEIAPVDFAIGDGERSFVPANIFSGGSSGNDQGIVFSPAWSPDGTTIAFFVTLDAIGREGFSRSEGEYKIFFMDPVEQKPYSVADKIYDGEELAWSPDSKWIVFIGRYGILGNYGIWLYSIEEEKVYSVTSGRFDEFAWSPDGTAIVATICEPDHPNILCDRYEIWEYDVSSITQK